MAPCKDPGWEDPGATSTVKTQFWKILWAAREVGPAGAARAAPRGPHADPPDFGQPSSVGGQICGRPALWAARSRAGPGEMTVLGDPDWMRWRS